MKVFWKKIGQVEDRHWFWILFSFVVLTLFPQVPLFPTLEGDALEIVAAVRDGGVIHSPGFPLYMVFVQIFSKLLFFFDAAYSVALFSVLCAGLSSSIVFWLGRALGADKGLSLVFSLLPLFALEVWYQSLIAEIYSLAVLWMLLIVQGFFLLKSKPNFKLTTWFVFLVVAGFGVHLYVWPLIPLGVVLFVWGMKNKWWKSNLKAIALGGFLGAMPFTYLPLMAGQSNYINEGNITSWQRFFDHVTWKLHRERLSSYEQQRQSDSGKWISVKTQQLKYFVENIVSQYERVLLIFLILLVIAIFNPLRVNHLQRGPPCWIHHLLFLFCIGLFCNIWVVFAGSDYQPSVLSEMKVHFVPIYYFFSLWLALSLSLLKDHRLKNGIAILLSVILLLHIAVNYLSLDLRSNDIALVHGRQLLEKLPPDTILFSQGDTDLMAMVYQQAANDFRTDVQVVNLVNGTQWYFDHLKATVKGFEWPMFYSKYFQLEILEKNYGKHPIFFSNYYSALLVLQQPTIKGRFLVVPERGGYKLTDEKRMIKEALDPELVVFEVFDIENQHSYELRDVEKDLAGQYKDYYSRRAELLSVFGKKELAVAEWNRGAVQPLFDSKFNQLVHEELLKVQKRFHIRNEFE